VLDIKSIKRSFNRAAKSYDKAAILQREVADRLLDSLKFMLIEPKTILDCGARTGYMTKALQERYPTARVISLDIAEQLLQQASCNLKLCSSAEALPIQKQSIDLIISNCNFHWSNDLSACFREARRVLKPEGLLLFTMLGRDTLHELRNSFGEDAQTHVHSFLDMHEVGDQLLQCGLVDPVMDMETITLRYQSIKAVFKDLKDTGSSNLNTERSRNLTGKKRWESMLHLYEGFRINNAYPASFEIIYGHAWQATQPMLSQENEVGEILVPVDSIAKQ